MGWGFVLFCFLAFFVFTFSKSIGVCYHSTSHETSKEMFLCHQKAQEGFSVSDEGKTPVFQNVVLQLS